MISLPETSSAKTSRSEVRWRLNHIRWCKNFKDCSCTEKKRHVKTATNVFLILLIVALCALLSEAVYWCALEAGGAIPNNDVVLVGNLRYACSSTGLTAI
ncbi:uncharacterized protein [Apostichopus japonicus]|uniref:uncharacterized protein isoform X2 n=1 Tax=Stichopus japonicus TaxID=307972 RepID=UPI003AB38726